MFLFVSLCLVSCVTCMCETVWLRRWSSYESDAMAEISVLRVTTAGEALVEEVAE